MLLDDIHAEFNLNQVKVVATVTDNGNNFVKAFKEFGVSIDSFDLVDSAEEENAISDEDNDADCTYEDDPPLQLPAYMEDRENANIQEQNINLPSHFRRAAHTLNLCATTDANRILQEVDENEHRTSLSDIHRKAMKKCNTLWNAAGRPKSAEIIQSVLGHTLSKPGVTRWNSLYDSMKQIYSIRHKNVELHKTLNLKHFINDSKFQYTKEFIICSSPIAEALDILQGGKNIFYGLLIPCLMTLRKKLQKLEDSSLKYCKELATCYSQSVQRRFEDFYCLFAPKGEHAAIATLSYRRFKNKWFSCIKPHDQERLKTIFKHIIAREISKETSKDAENEVIQEKENSFLDFASDSGSGTDVQRTHSPKTRADIMISQFFAEEDRNLKVLDHYTEIKTIFKKYNTPLPSSASVEHVFSYATMTNLLKSNKLSDSMFEKEMY